MLGEPLNSRKSNDVFFWATSSKNGTAYDQHHLGPKEIIRVLGRSDRTIGSTSWFLNLIYGTWQKHGRFSSATLRHQTVGDSMGKPWGKSHRIRCQLRTPCRDPLRPCPRAVAKAKRAIVPWRWKDGVCSWWFLMVSDWCSFCKPFFSLEECLWQSSISMEESMRCKSSSFPHCCELLGEFSVSPGWGTVNHNADVDETLFGSASRQCQLWVGENRDPRPQSHCLPRKLEILRTFKNTFNIF